VLNILTIQRDNKTQKVLIRQLPHDVQYPVGAKIKWGSGPKWTVTHVQLPSSIEVTL